MKKFAFLMAIVAVFAMSASAFAVDEDKITAVGSADPTKAQAADANNGALVVDKLVASTDVYYVGAIAENTKQMVVALSLDVNAKSDAGNKLQTLFDASTWTDATAGTQQGTDAWDDSHAAVLDGVNFTTEDEAIAKAGAQYKIGVTADSGNAWKDDTAVAAINVLPVEVAFAKSLDVYKAISNDSVSVDLKLDNGAWIAPGKDKLVFKEAVPKGVNCLINGSTIVVSTDSTISQDVTLVFKTLAVSDFDASDVVISDDVSSKIAIKGLAEDTDLVTIKLIAKDVPAQDLAAAISKDVNVVKNALNIVGPDNKVISKDVAITIVSGDAVKQQVTVISLDKDGNAVALGAPYSNVRINVAEGYAHSATESAASKDLALDATGYELKIGTGDIETMIRSLSTGRGADDTETKPYHLDVLGSVYKLDYQYSRQAVDTSSGGACDMGLGLAAAALAVVALRKRSK